MTPYHAPRQLAQKLLICNVRASTQLAGEWNITFAVELKSAKWRAYRKRQLHLLHGEKSSTCVGKYCLASRLYLISVQLCSAARIQAERHSEALAQFAS
eukprot:6209562-Pleurochrysis_carterae.AAC.1